MAPALGMSRKNRAMGADLRYEAGQSVRLTAIAQGSASVGFAYDSADRRTTLTLPNGVTVSYAYDNASHIVQLSYGTGGAGSTDVGTLTYNYDAPDHVIAKGGTLATTGLPTAVSGNTFNADNEMTGFKGTTLGYDANGNLNSDGTNTYAWHARNHLSALAVARLRVSSTMASAGARKKRSTVLRPNSYMTDGIRSRNFREVRPAQIF